MSTRPQESAHNDARWQKLLTEGHRPLRIAHLLFRHLPSPPRCKVCYNPFGGIGGKLVGLAGFSRSRKNPNLCARCCDILPPGGAEIDIAVLFADVRGSTALGEHLEPSAYAALMNRFYRAATEVLVRHDAIIDKLIGDAVMALFIPGICGPQYRRRAVEAALALLDTIGPGRSDAPQLPIGAAVNSGLTYVGNVGSDTIMKICADPDTKPDAEGLAAALRPDLLKSYKPALLGRLTIVPYFPLSDEVLRQIIKLQLSRIGSRVRDNYKARFQYDESLVETIARRCTEVESGARNRSVSHAIEQGLTVEIHAGQLDVEACLDCLFRALFRSRHNLVHVHDSRD